jgi:CheY-like chemotaxis protein
MRNGRSENIVLIADDDLFVRSVIRKGLESILNVEEVIDGDAVLEAYKRLMPDALLLDIHLPGKNGIELLDAIHAIDPEAYVVMISADSTTENVEITKAKGVKAFLTKPIHKQRLIDIIHQCPTILFKD